MRSRWMIFSLAGTVAALGAAPGVARAQTNPCAAQSCALVFDWGNGGEAPDVDRRYGSPSELEASMTRVLTGAGFHLASTGQAAALTMTVRVSQKNKALCDTMAGVNPDYTCHTADRASVMFTANDPAQKTLPRIDVSPRCSDPKNDPTFAQFGQYAGELVIYNLVDGGKGSRPSVKCR